MARRQQERRKQADRRASQREQRRARHDARRRKRRFIYLGASGVIAVLIIASFVVSALPGGRGGAAVSSGGTNQASYVDGVGEPQEIMASALHRDGAAITYNTTPPTSGDHWSAPTQCGFYENGVEDATIVHNLEHGNIILSYNFSDAADVGRMRAIHNNLNASDNWLVTRFYPKIAEGEVAIAAWGVLDRFTGIDEDRITRFFDTYKGNLFSVETRGLGQGIPCSNNPRLGR